MLIIVRNLIMGDITIVKCLKILLVIKDHKQAFFLKALLNFNLLHKLKEIQIY